MRLGFGKCPEPTDYQEELRVGDWIAYEHAIAEWCLRNGQKCLQTNSLENALKWHELAARTFTFGCDPLSSDELENNLRRVAQSLPSQRWSAPDSSLNQTRWLHVLDNALPYGGHSAMAFRWIANDPGKNIHSVALLNQRTSIPTAFLNAVHSVDGIIYLADPDASLLSRAAWLRKIAFETANYVVLHVHNSNVIAPVAFGFDGGPPVLLVNHSAHIFWLGVSIADIVLNCRGSSLEREWTLNYRGARRCGVLPIPLPSANLDRANKAFSAQEKVAAKGRLALPADSVVLLTVGAQFKYRPLGRISFFEAAKSILASCSQAHLLVVGPSEDRDWKSLREASAGRVQIMGRQFNLRQYHAATDVYLEGFPFGSTTSLLEAGSVGIPPVLAPNVCPPPFGSDGLALDELLPRPRSVEDYVEMARVLVDDSSRREVIGSLVAQSIIEHHTGHGWAKHLKKLVDELPLSHTVSTFQPKPPPRCATNFWAGFTSNWPDALGRSRGDILEYPFHLALEAGLRPKIDEALSRACKIFSRARRDGGAPVCLYILLGIVSRMLPVGIALVLFKWSVTLSRANGKLRRVFRSCFGYLRTKREAHFSERPHSTSQVGPAD